MSYAFESKIEHPKVKSGEWTTIYSNGDSILWTSDFTSIRREAIEARCSILSWFSHDRELTLEAFRDISHPLHERYARTLQYIFQGPHLMALEQSTNEHPVTRVDLTKALHPDFKNYKLMQRAIAPEWVQPVLGLTIPEVAPFKQRENVLDSDTPLFIMPFSDRTVLAEISPFTFYVNTAEEDKTKHRHPGLPVAESLRRLIVTLHLGSLEKEMQIRDRTNYFEGLAQSRKHLVERKKAVCEAINKIDEELKLRNEEIEFLNKTRH